MDIQDDVLLTIAKERIAEAERHAALRRAIRGDRPGSTVRIRLGLALIRFGRLVMGNQAAVRFQISTEH